MNEEPHGSWCRAEPIEMGWHEQEETVLVGMYVAQLLSEVPQTFNILKCISCIFLIACSPRYELPFLQGRLFSIIFSPSFEKQYSKKNSEKTAHTKK